jgi:predicted NBD/HSP70 family sugar kinase
MGVVSPRESQFLTLIRRHGPLSRRELHAHTGLRPNTVGETAGAMLERGLLREGASDSAGPGRPRQPLEIDPSRRRVIGLAFEPGQVSACQVNLLGHRIGGPVERDISGPEQLVAAACALIRDIGTDRALAIGISATGFVDPATRSILTSSATKRRSPTRIAAVYEAAGHCPVLLENDMHARAAGWLLNQGAEAAAGEDVLLIDLRDGAIGAALLVNGRPNRGCIIGGNELGHTRFPVETEVCFCGQTGCLERICSSAFLRRLTGDNRADLADRVAHFDRTDAALAQIASLVAMGVANAINFIRPNRVVLAGQLTDALPFCNDLLGRVRGLLLAPLAERVRIDVWERAAITPAEAAGWLALASIYRGGWSTTVAKPQAAKRRRTADAKA